MLYLAHQVFWMTGIKIAIHDIFCADTQVYQAYSRKRMVSCADNQYATFSCSRQGTLRYQQIPSDYESSRAVFYGCQLGILAISQHYQAARLNIIGHGLCLHCSNENAVSELAAPLYQYAAFECSYQVIPLQWYAIDCLWVQVVKE